MWKQYRKTTVVVQPFIATLCLVMKYLMRMPWPAVAVMFLVMQVGALLGAWWGARLRRKVTEQEEELPLKRRL